MWVCLLNWFKNKLGLVLLHFQHCQAGSYLKPNLSPKASQNLITVWVLEGLYSMEPADRTGPIHVCPANPPKDLEAIQKLDTTKAQTRSRLTGDYRGGRLPLSNSLTTWNQTINIDSPPTSSVFFFFFSCDPSCCSAPSPRSSLLSVRFRNSLKI